MESAPRQKEMAELERPAETAATRSSARFISAKHAAKARVRKLLVTTVLFSNDRWSREPVRQNPRDIYIYNPLRSLAASIGATS